MEGKEWEEQKECEEQNATIDCRIGEENRRNREDFWGRGSLRNKMYRRNMSKKRNMQGRSGETWKPKGGTGGEAGGTGGTGGKRRRETDENGGIREGI